MTELTPKQQAVELVRSANSILIVAHKNPDGDALGSSTALKAGLQKLGKTVMIACPDEPSASYSFIPGVSDVKTKIDTSSDFIISLSLKNADFDKLGYKRDKEKNTVDIVIAPKSGSGEFRESDITVRPAGQKFDLVIILDTPNFERLGSLAQPTDLFYEIPTINIDHHPSNDRFGKVNWVELTATSTAEILVSLLEALGRETNLLDKEIATSLLTGLIYDTSSFQNVNTTPKSLTVAAQLVAAGARQQEIIKNLYKTKSLETLKLWGTVLSNVKEDRMNRFLWSSITKADINRVGASEDALTGVVDELLKSATDVDFVLLLSERENQIHGSLRSIAKGINVAQITEEFGGGGHEVAAAFRVDGDLSSKEDEILTKIRKFQTNGTGQTGAPKVESEPEKTEPEETEKVSEEKPEEPAKPEAKEEPTPSSPMIGEVGGKIEEKAPLPEGAGVTTENVGKAEEPKPIVETKSENGGKPIEELLGEASAEEKVPETKW